MKTRAAIAFEAKRPHAISTRPFQLAGHRVRRRQGRTHVPTIVDCYMNGAMRIDPMITHRLTLDESIRAVAVY